MGKPKSLDDPFIREKQSLLSEEEAVGNPSIRPWIHRRPKAAVGMVLLMMCWPLAFFFLGFPSHSQSPISDTGRCTKL